MAAPDLSSLIQSGYAVLATTVNAITGKILAQLGDVRGATDTDGAEWWQHVGFASRPSKAEKNKSAAQVVVLKGGDRDTCIASQDMRGLELYGNLKEGETCLYGAGEYGTSQGRVIIKSDGSVTLFTTDTNEAGGKTVALRVSPTGGLEFTSQWGSLTLNETGFHVKTAGGPRLDMGSITVPGVPAAVTGAFTGYAKMTAPTVQLEGANCVLGMGPVFGQCVNGNPALLINGGPLPLGLTDLAAQAVFGSNTVWVSM